MTSRYSEFFHTTGALGKLVEALNKLPGVGPKTAQRLAYYLIRTDDADARGLALAIIDIRDRITYCSICQNITEADPCRFCTDENRDSSRICVVEEPLDVIAMERTGSYKGTYHVLHGVLSPLDNIGPENLQINELVTRLQENTVTEIILATNPSVEGETTAMYIRDLCGSMVSSITRLARGLPVGGDLEYADDVTLIRAMEGRQEF